MEQATSALLSLDTIINRPDILNNPPSPIRHLGIPSRFLDFLFTFSKEKDSWRGQAARQFLDNIYHSPFHEIDTDIINGLPKSCENITAEDYLLQTASNLHPSRPVITGMDYLRAKLNHNCIAVIPLASQYEQLKAKESTIILPNDWRQNSQPKTSRPSNSDYDSIHNLTSFEASIPEQQALITALSMPADSCSIVLVDGASGVGKTLIASTFIADGFCRHRYPGGIGYINELYPEEISYVIQEEGRRHKRFHSEVSKHLTDFYDQFPQLMGHFQQDQLIIYDEAQEYTIGQMAQFIKETGRGSKSVFIGNTKKIVNPYLNRESCGLGFFMQERSHQKDPKTAIIKFADR